MTQRLFDSFKHGLYLKNWSPRTPIVYQRAFTSYRRSLPEGAHVLTKAALEARVISRREAGWSPPGINIYIRSLNSFLSWLKEEGDLAEPIKLKQLKAPQKPINVLADADIRAISSYRPRGFFELRAWTITQTPLAPAAASTNPSR